MASIDARLKLTYDDLELLPNDSFRPRPATASRRHCFLAWRYRWPRSSRH
jgi:hypothetical protein